MSIRPIRNGVDVLFFHFSGFRRYDDDSDDSTVETRKRRRDSEGEKAKDPSSKSKKKHKKHKKNKKSSKHDGDVKERSSSSKKHKKHRKRHKSHNDESISDVEETLKHDDVQIAEIEREVIVKPMTSIRSNDSDATTPKSSTSTSTLNTKFTQIMKSNGHVVIPKTLATKNGTDAPTSTKASSSSSSSIPKISTDPSELVESIKRSLDVTVPAMHIVSSGSESDGVQDVDVDSPDVAVIEDDELNLEELMRQKALLQERLGDFVMSDTEGDGTPKARTPPLDKVKMMMIRSANGKLMSFSLFFETILFTKMNLLLQLQNALSPLQLHQRLTMTLSNWMTAVMKLKR